MDKIKHFHDTENQERVQFDLFNIIEEWWPEKCKETLVELHAHMFVAFEIDTKLENNKQVVESISVSGQKFNDFMVTKIRNTTPFYV